MTDDIGLDADLDAGFTDEPVVVTKTIAEVQPEIAYAQLTIEELEQLRTRASQVDELKTAQDKQFSTAFGKMGMLEKTLKDMREAAEQNKGEPLGEIDLSSLKAEYPELAAMLAKDLAPVISRRGKDFDQAQLDQMVNDRLSPAIQVAETRIEQRMERKALTRAVNDWEQVVVSDPFKAWVGKQPADKQAEINNSWDSDYIVKTINEFRQSIKKVEPKTAPKPDTRTARLEAAVQPRGTAGVSPLSSDLDEFEKGFNG